jgi:hypothetical protein
VARATSEVVSAGRLVTTTRVATPASWLAVLGADSECSVRTDGDDWASEPP